MAVIKLTASPQTRTETGGISFMVAAGALARTRVEAKSVSEIRAAVKTFGDATAKEYPTSSFGVSVDVAPGSRAPAGYKKEYEVHRFGSAFGGDAWTRTKAEA